MTSITREVAYKAMVCDSDRGPSRVFGYYDSYSKAVDAVRGKSWYGSNGYVDSSPVNVLVFTDEKGKTYRFIEKDQIIIKTMTPEEEKEYANNLRKNALAKLSEEEKVNLGLKSGD